MSHSSRVLAGWLPLSLALLCTVPAVAQFDADLALAVDLPTAPLPVGVAISCTIDVTNHGPDEATDVQVGGSFPSTDWTVLGYSNPYGSVDERFGFVTAYLGGLAAGQTKSVQIQIRPDRIGDLSAVVSTSDSHTIDPDGTNNECTAYVTTVAPNEVDLVLSGFESPGDVLIVDDEAAFTMRLRNNGPLTATTVDLAIDVSGTAARDIDRIECPTGGGTTVQIGDRTIVRFAGLPVDPGDGSAEETVLLYLTPLGEGTLDLSAAVSCDQDEAAPGDELVEDSWTATQGSTPVAAALPLPGGVVAAPNPFNPRTVIRFELDRVAAVRLEVYDARGGLVQRLLDGVVLGPGPHGVPWDGRISAGGDAAAGAYFVRLQVGDKVERNRMTLVR